MTGLSKILTKERIAFLLVFLAGLNGQLAVILDYFPNNSTVVQAVTMGSSFIAQALVVLKFLSGANNWDNLQVAGVPSGTKVVNITSAPSFTGSGIDEEAEQLEPIPADHAELLSQGAESEDTQARAEGFGG